MSLLCPRKISSSSNNISHKEDGTVLSKTLLCPDNVDRTVREWVQLAEQKGKTFQSNSGQSCLGSLLGVGAFSSFPLKMRSHFFLHSRQECHLDQMSPVQC